MKRKLFPLCLLIFVSFNPGWGQSQRSYDQLVSPHVFLYMEWDTENSDVPSYPVYEEAMVNFFETLDDFLEWRIIKNEWNAINEPLGVEDVSNALVGKQWALAVSNFDIQEFKIPSLMYMTRLDEPREGYEILKNFAQQITPSIDILRFEEEEYRGSLVGYLFGPGRIPGLGLAFAYEENTLFISTSKPSLMKTLDSIEYREESLADNETYQSVISQLPTPRHWTLYANPGQITQDLKGIVNGLKETIQHEEEEEESDQPEEDSNEAEEEVLSNPFTEHLHKELSNNLQHASPMINTVDSFLTFAARIPAFVVSARYLDENYKHVQTYIQVDSAEETTVWDRILQRDKIVFPFEDYMLRRTGTVNFGNVFGPNDLWSIAQSHLENLPQVENEVKKTMDQWEEEYGLSLEEDLLSWMGHEWCFLRPVMDLESVIPVARSAFLIKVTNVEKARAGMQKISDLIKKQSGDLISVHQETYQKRQLTTYQLKIPVLPYTPSWCIDDGVFILTTNASMLREMLDVEAGRRGGLSRNRYYKHLREYFLKPANMVAFQDNESEFYAFREGARRVASLQNLTSGDDREKIVPVMIMDRVAYFLSTLLVIKGTVKHRVLNSDEIVLQKHQYLNDLRVAPSADSVFRYKISLGARDAIEEAASYFRTIGDQERAIRFYKTLSEFYPKNEKYLRELARIQEDAEGVEAAIDVYNRALEHMPDTALVIKREMLREDTSLEQILTAVESIASQTQRVDEKAALLGIAFGKRDAGDIQQALELFKHITEHFPDTQAAKVAKQEGLLLQYQVPENCIRVAHVDVAPKVDGVPLGKVWENAFEPVPLYPLFSDEQHNIYATFLHDQNKLIIAMQGKMGEKDSEMEIKCLVLPNRDYVHAKMFTNQLDSIFEHEEVEQNIQHFSLDPWGLTLEKENSELKEKEVMEGEWLFALDHDEDRWSVEMAIPLNEMIQDYPENESWTEPVPINLIVTMKQDGKEREWMLTREGVQESFVHLPLLDLEKPSQ